MVVTDYPLIAGRANIPFHQIQALAIPQQAKQAPQETVYRSGRQDTLGSKRESRRTRQE